MITAKKEETFIIDICSYESQSNTQLTINREDAQKLVEDLTKILK